MKRIASAFVLLLLLSVVFTVCLPQIGIVKAEPKTIVVPDDYPTITSAIGNASEGDTIFIKSGTYHEHLQIEKALSLVGEDKETTIVDGNKAGSVISIKEDGVDVKNLTIQNSGDVANLSAYYYTHVGIHLIHVSYCNLSGNILVNNGYGIWLFDSPENSITGNSITTGQSGIRLDSSDHNRVNGNTIKNNTVSGQFGFRAFGLIADDSSENTVMNNTLTENMYGVWLHDSSNNRVVENIIADNDYGLILSGSSSNNTFGGNDFINVNQVDVFPDLSNTWNENGKGNYWSDYNGTDKDGNGIGDTPYTINENNQDNHPQIKPAITPEFPSWLVLFLLLATTVTLVAAVLLFYSKKRSTKPPTPPSY